MSLPDAITPPRLRNPIRTLRFDRGLSIADLAAVAGLGRAAMSKVEAGMMLVSVAQQHALAAKLGVDPDELAYLVDVTKPGS